MLGEGERTEPSDSQMRWGGLVSQEEISLRNCYHFSGDPGAEPVASQ